MATIEDVRKLGKELGMDSEMIDDTIKYIIRINRRGYTASEAGSMLREMFLKLEQNTKESK